MEIFSCGTKIIAGAGAISALEEFGAKRLFLVTDPFFMKSGAAQKVIAASKAEQSEIFDGVLPDPSVELAAQGTARIQAFGPDLIVALGGGSAMDCAKAMAYFGGGEYRLVAIPTTSGSGSEVTDFAILTHGDVKHPLVDERLRPDAAILDSDFLGELPRGLIADTGFDVMAHALEAWVAVKAGSVSDCLAKESFRMAMQALPKSFAGDKTVRLQMHKAATMAGIAFSQAGLGLCHAMAHGLGGMFHVPHGRLNAILLPAVIGVNASGALGKYAVLAREAGFSGTGDTMSVRSLKNGLIRLRRELQLPESLAQAGVDVKQLRQQEQKIVEAVLQDPCCGTNPVKVEPNMVRQVLSEVAGRG